LAEGGYLYAFANDAWERYDDNQGSVRLTVRPIGADPSPRRRGPPGRGGRVLLSLFPAPARLAVVDLPTG